MNYKPANAGFGDAWCAEIAGEAHLFHLSILKPGEEAPKDLDALAHAVSPDLLHWTQLPPALLPAETGAQEDLQMWTGCSVNRGNENYLFYTGRSSADGGKAQHIGLATSRDMRAWTRVGVGPVLSPDPDLYFSPAHKMPSGVVDCRDFMVIERPEGGYLGFYAARMPAEYQWQGPAIGVARSEDLLRWTHLPAPAFAPARFGLAEVPDVFPLDGKWYMMALTHAAWGNRSIAGQNCMHRVTVYAASDRPEGPYHLNDDYVLAGNENDSGGFAHRSVVFHGQRYVLGIDRGEPGTSTISPPFRPYVNKSGCLRLGWAKITEGYRARTLLRKGGRAAIESVPGAQPTGLPNGAFRANGGAYEGFAQWGWQQAILSVPEAVNAEIEAEIRVDCGAAAGLCFGNLAVLLDAEKKEVFFGDMSGFGAFARYRTRAFEVARNQWIHLRLRFRGPRLECYINDELIYQAASDQGAQARKTGLIVDRARAAYRNLAIYELED